jgi:hypothetical protein
MGEKNIFTTPFGINTYHAVRNKEELHSGSALRPTSELSQLVPDCFLVERRENGIRVYKPKDITEYLFFCPSM